MMTALKQVESHVRNFFNKGRTQIPEILVRHPIKVFSRHIYSGKFFKIEGGEIKLQPLVKRDLQDVKELLLALGRSNESCGKAIERIKKKAKSGLLNRAIGKEDLIDKSRKFRFEREKARVAKMRDKPWREDWETSSKSKLRRASQINTENKLIRCGIDFDNCLDKQDHRNYDPSSLKEGEKELVRVDDPALSMLPQSGMTGSDEANSWEQGARKHLDPSSIRNRLS